MCSHTCLITISNSNEALVNAYEDQPLLLFLYDALQSAFLRVRKDGLKRSCEFVFDPHA